jgi:hypothetical protein
MFLPSFAARFQEKATAAIGNLRYPLVCNSGRIKILQQSDGSIARTKGTPQGSVIKTSLIPKFVRGHID